MEARGARAILSIRRFLHLTTTVDLLIMVTASCLICFTSSGDKKLWYIKARGSQDTICMNRFLPGSPAAGDAAALSAGAETVLSFWMAGSSPASKPHNPSPLSLLHVWGWAPRRGRDRFGKEKAIIVVIKHETRRKTVADHRAMATKNKDL